jgi:hypothetical protein
MGPRRRGFEAQLQRHASGDECVDEPMQSKRGGAAQEEGAVAWRDWR